MAVLMGCHPWDKHEHEAVLVGCHPCDRHEHVVVLMECLPSSPDKWISNNNTDINKQ
jgi:hypothetical protein